MTREPAAFRVVQVLVMDLAGAHRAADAMPPERFVRTLQAARADFESDVQASGGTMCRWDGESAQAVWSAGRWPSGDETARLVRRWAGILRDLDVRIAITRGRGTHVADRSGRGQVFGTPVVRAMALLHEAPKHAWAAALVDPEVGSEIASSEPLPGTTAARGVRRHVP